jgi:hypothetical protein
MTETLFKPRSDIKIHILPKCHTFTVNTSYSPVRQTEQTWEIVTVRDGAMKHIIQKSVTLCLNVCLKELMCHREKHERVLSTMQNLYNGYYLNYLNVDHFKLSYLANIPVRINHFLILSLDGITTVKNVQTRKKFYSFSFYCSLLRGTWRINMTFEKTA